MAAAEAEETLAAAPETKESPIVATPVDGWGAARTEIAQQPSGASSTPRVRPLGSVVERVRRTPRPARFTLSTRFGGVLHPGALAAHQVAAEEAAVVLLERLGPDQEAERRVEGGGGGVVEPRRDRVGGRGRVSGAGRRLGTSRSTGLPAPSEKLIRNGFRSTTARARGASTTIRSAPRRAVRRRARRNRNSPTSEQAVTTARAPTLPAPRQGGEGRSRAGQLIGAPR